MKKIGLLSVVVFAFIFTACDKEDDEAMFVDGTYYAEGAEFSRGWKAYMEAEISDDELVAVEFDYLNEEGGGLKSETTVENYPMDPHPTQWIPEYESRLLAADITSFSEVDVITGATGAWGNVNALMDAILAAAEEGDTGDQVINLK